MTTVIICTSCGSRTTSDLGPNERDLVNVGMLELHCRRCGADTRWGLADDYRRGSDRRKAERRKSVGRWSGPERRKGERRSGFDRRQGRPQ